MVNLKRYRRRGAKASYLISHPYVQAESMIRKITLQVVGAGGEHFELEFPRQLTPEERASLNREIAKWRAGAYDLNTALMLAGLFPDCVYRIFPNGLKEEADASTVLGKSFTVGRMRDFLFHESGLDQNTLSALEIAFFRKAKNPRHDPNAFFARKVQDRTQLAVAKLIFSRLADTHPARGFFHADADEISQLKEDIDEMMQERAEYMRAERTGRWNIALIHTPRGDYHLRIPLSLASPEDFSKMVTARKSPDKIALVFNLFFVSDLLLSRPEHGSYRATTQQERMYINSLAPQDLEMTVISPFRQLRKPSQQRPTL